MAEVFARVHQVTSRGFQLKVELYLPLPPRPSLLGKKTVNRKPTFYVLCKIDIFNIVLLLW